MREYINIEENGLNVVFEKCHGGVRLLHFSCEPFDEQNILRGYSLLPWETEEEMRDLLYPVVETGILGEDQKAHSGEKHNGSNSAARLLLRRVSDSTENGVRCLSLVMGDEQIDVEYTMRFYSGLPAARINVSVINKSKSALPLSYVSSFALTGLLPEGQGSWGDRAYLTRVENSWCAECRIDRKPLKECGLPDIGGTTGRAVCSGLGTWSSGSWLPLGLLSDDEKKTCLFWQIEHCGSWQWEIGEDKAQLQLLVSGPTEQESGWVHVLRPGERFDAVPVTVGCVRGEEQAALQTLNACRRELCAKNMSFNDMPVIFNDFMNIDGEPTSKKLRPLIDAAAELGCEYFIIDCGWYCEESWWEVGDWQPNNKRFPNGIEESMQYIKSRGMKPGIWLEIEKVSVENCMAAALPNECFFSRHNHRVIANSRYQLDFRCKAVRDFADAVVDRLVTKFGAEYIKMDYNCNAGVGTDTNADSAGDGLLGHNRAYLKWLDGVFTRYPKLVIENCGSGGMRLDYALLSRHQIQSLTDQTDYQQLALISANSAVALTPEQTGVWSYPSAGGDVEETAMNMVNAMLKRIHQSGFVTKLSPESLSLVKEGISVYKKIRSDIPICVPAWPTGFATEGQPWTSFALMSKTRLLLAVWRLGDQPQCTISLDKIGREPASVKCLYPATLPLDIMLDAEKKQLTIRLPQKNCARLLEVCF